MKISIHRDKRIALSFYPAKIMADEKEIGFLENGETQHVSLPSGTQKLSIQTGPYISNSIEVDDLYENATVNARPDISPWFILVAVIICVTALALGVSGFKFVFVLFVFLGIDLALNRTKWNISLQ